MITEASGLEFSSEPQFFPPNQHQALDKTMTNLYNIVRKVNYTSGAGKYTPTRQKTAT